jgi:methanogenic corrinoid protein MtbC1
MTAPAAQWYDGYLDALRAGDRRRALDVLDDARADGLDVRDIYLDVLQPAMRAIGRLWQENELTVAEEHLATAVTQLAMGRLYAECCSGAEPIGRTLLAACVDGERHELGLRMVCDLLEVEGWDARYLGAAVPVESLVAMVTKERPDALALSASTAPRLPELKAMIAAVRAACGDEAPFILAGGRPFLEDAALALRLGADATSADAAGAVALLRERFA